MKEHGSFWVYLQNSEIGMRRGSQKYYKIDAHDGNMKNSNQIRTPDVREKGKPALNMLL